MTYKIMQQVSTSATVDYWIFVKVDSTSTTDFSTTIQDDLEIKLKDLLISIPKGKLKIITEISFTDDLIFI